MQISAHRSVLSASSEYFKTMFTPPFIESTSRAIKLPNVDGESLKSLVKFCYSGRLVMNEDTAKKLLVTADSLLLDTVVNACDEFLAELLLPTNCFGMAQLAERHHCVVLPKKAQNFCIKHFVELCKTDEFLTLDVEQLGGSLASDELRVPNEADVFKSLMAWLAYASIERREQHRDDLLKFVRMPLMKSSFLVEHLKSVCTSNASRQLYDAAIERNLLPPECRAVNASNKSTKPRKPNDHQCLMAITEENKKLNIRYHCPKQFQWTKWLGDLEYRREYGVTVMDDDLFIVGGQDRNGDFLNNVICASLKTMTRKVVNQMNEYRWGASVAALKGFLYAVGDYNASGNLNSEEKWHSQSNNWSTVAQLAAKRSFCTTAILSDKLHVIEGQNRNGHLTSVEFDDSQANAWPTVASMCETHAEFYVAAVGGTLYAVDGIGSKTIESCDPENNRWTVDTGLYVNFIL